jgi:hypothetical protein
MERACLATNWTDECTLQEMPKIRINITDYERKIVILFFQVNGNWWLVTLSKQLNYKETLESIINIPVT